MVACASFKLYQVFRYTSSQIWLFIGSLLKMNNEPSRNFRQASTFYWPHIFPFHMLFQEIILSFWVSFLNTSVRFSFWWSHVCVKIALICCTFVVFVVWSDDEESIFFQGIHDDMYGSIYGNNVLLCWIFSFKYLSIFLLHFWLHPLCAKLSSSC